MKKFFIILVVILLLKGYVWHFWNLSVSSASEEMISFGHLVAVGLRGEMIKELGGVPEDEDTVAFQSIKNRLEEFLKFDSEISFIYLYGLRDGNLYFMADGELSSSPDYSPPGQPYEEAESYYYLPFEDKKSLITSPVSDRWGTWVTTLTPIIDDSGEVIAVLGIDVDSELWKGRVLGKMLLPLAVILFLIGIFLFYFIFFLKKPKTNKAAIRKLFPFFVLLVFLMVAVPGFLFFRWEMSNLEGIARKSTGETMDIMKGLLEQQQEGLAIATQAIANNKSVKERLIEEETESLLSDWEDIFREMNSIGDLTHFYFFNKERVCILRIHNPEKRGDFINRFTAKEAEETRKVSMGIEIGPLGTFTLRVVEPIFIENEVIGYVELGKEIEDVMVAVAETTKNYVVVTIDKENLKRDSWESGMQMLGRNHDWDYFDDRAIIYNNIDIPKEIWPVLGDDKRFFFGNSSWMSSVYSAVDSSGKSVGEIIIIRDVSEDIANLQRILFNGGVLSLILLLIISFIAHNVLNKTDEIITKQNKDLEESFDRFNSIANQSRTFIWEADKEAKYIYLSDNVKDILGYSKEELLGKSVIDLLPEEGKEQVKKEIFKILNNKERMIGFENPIIHKNGKIIWVLSSGLPVVDEKNNLIKYRGSDLDITKRKEIEDALIASNQELAKFKMAVENTSEHVVITDPDGICLYANMAAEKITGFSRGEILGKKVGTKENWGGIMEKEIYEELWKKIKKDQQSFVGELNNKRKNGEEYIAKASISPVINKDGEAEFFVGIERDISEERRIDKAKTEFVSLASHQLRTPLSTINWYAEMLLDGTAGKVTKDQEKYLKEIYAGNQRMVALVNSLLNVSRIELGTFAIDPEVVDIEELLKEVVKELEPQIKEKNQEVKAGCQAKISKIKADPKLLQIIFQNLLSNAVKYTPNGGKIEVIVKTVKRGDEIEGRKIKKESIFIAVRDNGYGITENQQNRIFTKLFRADNVQEKDTEGTGLGLYIVKAIVDHSAGEIWFDSRENKGTSFYVILPIDGMKKKEGSKRIN